MNDGRQMVGQMLAFDKVWKFPEFRNTCIYAYFYIAHEPRSRRYRRVQTR